MRSQFVEAINEKKLVKVKFISKEKGIIERLCVPFDYSINKKDIIKKEKYQLLDLESPTGKPHNISILEENIISIEKTNQDFEPEKYITWDNIIWEISRDWGIYS